MNCRVTTAWISNFATKLRLMDISAGKIIKMRDVKFDKSLFVNFATGTVLDNLLAEQDGE